MGANINQLRDQFIEDVMEALYPVLDALDEANTKVQDVLASGGIITEIQEGNFLFEVIHANVLGHDLLNIKYTLPWDQYNRMKGSYASKIGLNLEHLAEYYQNAHLEDNGIPIKSFEDELISYIIMDTDIGVDPSEEGLVFTGHVGFV